MSSPIELRHARSPGWQNSTPSEPAEPCRFDAFSVGDWLAEPALCRLSRGGSSIRLRPQIMDLLVCLAQRAGHVVPRAEIFHEVWPGQYVAESGLARCVAELRQALQDAAQEPTFIETIPKRGYRLIAPVNFLGAAPPAVSPPSNGQQAAGAEPALSPADGRFGEAGTPAGDLAAEALRHAASAVPPRSRVRRGWIAVASVSTIAAAVVLALMLRPAIPALSETDRLILCFENHTGESVFDGTLQLALAVQLEQSPFLRVISDEQARQTLRSMGYEPNIPFTRALAMEVCRRDGAKAVLAGSVGRLGDRYVLGLEAIACATNEALAREQAEAGGKNEVLDALGGMATRIRRRLGESPASVARYDVPIASATTGSLEAAAGGKSRRPRTTPRP